MAEPLLGSRFLVCRQGWLVYLVLLTPPSCSESLGPLDTWSRPSLFPASHPRSEQMALSPAPQSSAVLFLCFQMCLLPYTSSSPFLCLRRGSDLSLHWTVVQCSLEIKGVGCGLSLPSSILDTTPYWNTLITLSQPVSLRRKEHI